jgi:hypothetical protein
MADKGTGAASANAAQQSFPGTRPAAPQWPPEDLTTTHHIAAFFLCRF